MSENKNVTVPVGKATGLLPFGSVSLSGGITIQILPYARLDLACTPQFYVQFERQ